MHGRRSRIPLAIGAFWTAYCAADSDAGLQRVSRFRAVKELASTFQTSAVQSWNPSGAATRWVLQCCNRCALPCAETAPTHSTLFDLHVVGWRILALLLLGILVGDVGVDLHHLQCLMTQVPLQRKELAP